MVTSTKAVIKLLEKAFKKNGYKLIEKNERTVISTGSVVIAYQTDTMPREILGVIAKHSGMIPNSMSYTCSKGGGVQILLEDKTDSQFLTIPKVGNCSELHMTPLTYYDTVLYQDEENQIFGILSGAIALVGDTNTKPVRRGESKIIAWYGESDELYLVARTKDDNAMLAELEYKRWESL